MVKTITRKEVDRMRIKGKPKCPSCGNPFSYIFEGSKGMTEEKCRRCKTTCLVDTETLEVIRIEKAS